MASRRISLIIISLSIILVSVFANPSPVEAALGVSSVTPNSVVNNVMNELTITGTDFVAGAQVSVGGTSLATLFVDSTTLKAILPSGFLSNVYTVRVTLLDTTFFDLPAALTVLSPTPVPTSGPFVRPQIIINSYSLSVGSVRTGQEFETTIRLYNVGLTRAYGIQVTYTSTDLLMLRNGGVAAVGSMDSGGSVDLIQAMTAAASLSGKHMVSADMNVSYYDEGGGPYNDKFTLNFPVSSSSGSTAQATPTPKGVFRSQLVITDYETDLDPLQPGALFKLNLTIQNTGNLAAKGVTMIVGGGSTYGSGSGTPSSGGISGGSGEFSNFAPVGTSNIQALGDFLSGDMKKASQQLIVNVYANPGAYPMKITFSYTDERGNLINDDQVITLLIYSLPQIEVGFYQPVSVLFVGQPGALPLQVVNLGKKLAVLGTMKIEAGGAMVENGEMLIGTLDVGGYFPIDAVVYPDSAGTLDLVITIDYTDDFNQARTITKTLPIQVEEYFEPVPEFPDSGNGEIPVDSQETFWHKVWRFILGLLGLDSNYSSPVGPEIPVESKPGESVPVPAVPGKGGGKG